MLGLKLNHVSKRDQWGPPNLAKWRKAEPYDLWVLLRDRQCWVKMYAIVTLGPEDKRASFNLKRDIDNDWSFKNLWDEITNHS